MSKVFPEQMNRLDYGDTEGSLRIIDSYIRTMCEKIDFSITGISKEMGIDLTRQVYDLETDTTKLKSEVSVIEGKATSAQNKANEAYAKADTAQGTADRAEGKADSALSGLENKVDKVQGKGLSTEDFTTEEKNKLDNLKPYSFVGMIVQSTTLTQLTDLQDIYGDDTDWLQHDGYLLISASSNVTDNQAQEDNTDTFTADPTGTAIKSKNIYVWERIL